MKKTNKYFFECKIVSIVLSIAVVIGLAGDFAHRMRRKLSESNSIGKYRRPVMKTFYSPLSLRKSNKSRNELIVDVWKEEWERAGFETQVVTLSDAKRHPYFETMKAAVEKAWPTNVYNQYCFYRYLAMATTGGGWHSDFDTMPANFPPEKALNLLNDGNFTSCEWFIPSLISASAEEWTKVAKLLVNQISKTSSGHPSDMILLRDFYAIPDQKDIIFMLREEGIVRRPTEFLKHNVMDCPAFRPTLAIHFSHHDMKKLFDEGKFPINVPNDKKQQVNKADYRGLAIKKLMDAFREQCLEWNEFFQA